MILAMMITNREGNILIERFNGVQAEERPHWRTFLTKLGAENFPGMKSEELLIACNKSTYIVYTLYGDICIYAVGKDDYDELALSDVIWVIITCIKDACGKTTTERNFLDKYGRICLCIDEVVWKGLQENIDIHRIKRLMKLKPPTQF